MDARLYNEIISKIPQVVADLLKNESESEKNVMETVCLYNSIGNMIQKDVFFICDTEMVRHIETAHRKGFDIQADNSSVIVKRNLSNGDYYVVEYKTIA